MIEIPTQLMEECPACHTKIGPFYMPFGDEAIEKSKEYKIFQIVRSVFHGIRKPRSVVQLNRFFGKCAVIANNTDDKNFNTKDRVAEQIKIAIRFIREDLIIVKPNQEVHVPYRSISFKELPHMEACRFFDRADDAFEDICKRLKIDRDVLEHEAKKETR